MPEKTLTALKVGASTTELREFDIPEIADDEALLKMEVAGVCGTDVAQYRLPLRGGPLIMGHENVGYLAKVGKTFEERKGFKEGDLVFLEHYPWRSLVGTGLFRTGRSRPGHGTRVSVALPVEASSSITGGADGQRPVQPGRG